MAKRKPIKEKIADEVNEPVTLYHTPKKLSELFKNITIFTLAEQEDETRAYSASFRHVQRMAYLSKLNQIAFAHVLENPSENLWDKNIYITIKNGHIS